VLAVILAVAATVLLVRGFVRRFAAARAEQALDDERISLWSWRAWFAELRRAVAARLARRPRPSSSTPSAAAALRADRERTTDMRQVYRDLLAWAARRGHPRAPATTAIELERQLTAAGAAPAKDLAAVTAAYLDARYGERALAGDEVARARRIVDRLDTGELG
jgi:hypothetical protein